MSKYTHPTVSAAPGFDVYPLDVTQNGVVTFTNDGTNEIRPTQLQCERYGYKFDVTTGTCYAFKPTFKLIESIGQTTNFVKGQDNIISRGVENTSITGQSNTVLNNTRSNVIIGNNHTINKNLNNGIVTGTKANVTTSGSLTMGGNQPTDNLSERQLIILQYGSQNTDASTIASGINNEAGKRFAVPDNAIIYFHAEALAVRTGGSYGSGQVGDYYSAVERGVLVNESGTCSIARERDTIKTSGYVNNWRILAQVGSGNTLSLTTRGHANITIEWNISVRITMIQTDVSL